MSPFPYTFPFYFDPAGTFTYDITTTVGKIRLLIGDKYANNPRFSDEELTFFYQTEGSINLAAAAALEAWAALYSIKADSEKMGDYSYNQSTAEKMLDLAARLREKESEVPAMGWAEFNFTGIEETD